MLSEAAELVSKSQMKDDARGSGCVRVLGDENLTTALVDCLSHHAHIRTAKSAFYRTRMRTKP